MEYYTDFNVAVFEAANIKNLEQNKDFVSKFLNTFNPMLDFAYRPPSTIPLSFEEMGRLYDFYTFVCKERNIKNLI